VRYSKAPLCLTQRKWRGKSREKMQRHTETFCGYKVTGWQEHKQHVWRIRTWPADKDHPEHEYWVIDGKFYEEGVAIPFSYPSRYYSELWPRPKRQSDRRRKSCRPAPDWQMENGGGSRCSQLLVTEISVACDLWGLRELLRPSIEKWRSCFCSRGNPFT